MIPPNHPLSPHTDLLSGPDTWPGSCTWPHTWSRASLLAFGTAAGSLQTHRYRICRGGHVTFRKNRRYFTSITGKNNLIISTLLQLLLTATFNVTKSLLVNTVNKVTS